MLSPKTKPSESGEPAPGVRPPVGEGEFDPDSLGSIVSVVGVLTTIAGLITWFSAYAGVDDWRQIQIGIVITGFGVTWWVLGQILRAIARKR